MPKTLGTHKFTDSILTALSSGRLQTGHKALALVLKMMIKRMSTYTRRHSINRWNRHGSTNVIVSIVRKNNYILLYSMNMLRRRHNLLSAPCHISHIALLNYSVKCKGIVSALTHWNKLGSMTLYCTFTTFVCGYPRHPIEVLYMHT